jgi:hypothetical protein
VMKTWVQSNLKVNSQANPKKTKFHSRMTTTGSSPSLGLSYLRPSITQ